MVSLRFWFSHLVLWRNHTWHRKELRVQQWMRWFQKDQNTGPEVLSCHYHRSLNFSVSKLKVTWARVVQLGTNPQRMENLANLHLL